MSRTALEVKASRKPKFSSRAYNRCPICGRPRAFMRQLPYLLPQHGPARRTARCA